MENEPQFSINHDGMANILKELSDIRKDLAVNSSETQNIKGMVSEVRSDLKVVKNETISRREFTEAQTSIQNSISKSNDNHETRLASLETWKLVFVTKFSVYSAIALFLGSLASTLLLTWFKTKL